jgi:hypothetical protein
MHVPGDAHPPNFAARAVSTERARHDPTAWREADIVDLLEEAQIEVRRNDGARDWQDALIAASHERMVALVGTLMRKRTSRQQLADRCRDVVHHVFMTDLPGWLRSEHVTDLSREGFCGMFLGRAAWRLDELHGKLSRQPVTVGDADAALLADLDAEERAESLRVIADAAAMLDEIGNLPGDDREIADLRLVRGKSLAEISRTLGRSPDAVQRSMKRINSRLEACCGRCA